MTVKSSGTETGNLNCPVAAMKPGFVTITGFVTEKKKTKILRLYGGKIEIIKRRVRMKVAANAPCPLLWRKNSSLFDTGTTLSGRISCS